MDNKIFRNNIFSKSDDELLMILSRYWNMPIEDLGKPFKL